MEEPDNLTSNEMPTVSGGGWGGRAVDDVGDEVATENGAGTERIY